MALTFYIADNIQECENNDSFVQFDEEIHKIIWEDREKLPALARKLYSLDPYEVTCLIKSEFEQLSLACSELQLVYKENKFMSEFFESFILLCFTAYRKEKNIMAVGD